MRKMISYKSKINSQLPIRQLENGFTLIELLVVIAIIAILAAMLLPVLASSKERAYRSQCVNNLRQISIAIFSYASDSDDYFPPLKWRDGNPQYPYEILRYTPVNTPVNGTTSTYDSDGGPYNLGVLWNNKSLPDGKILYCPSPNQTEPDLTYDFYNTKAIWPWGGDPTASNPGYVRSGYSYYPQSKVTAKFNTASFGNVQVPFWPDYSGSPAPLNTWICVPPFRQSQVDQNKSMVVDVIYKTLAQISHKSGQTPMGLNAAFGDGHVAWQGVKKVTSGFDATEWSAIAGGSGGDLRFVESCWQP
jgi:prepilin-type N-terminal cleavage/methylation domain-containing protein/prepilin-type processing-associated H-X9-DG protein